MHIREFDTVDRDTAAAVVRAWADVPSWVHAVVAARPYGSTARLAGTALRLAADWTGAEVDAALAQHPRIGDRPDPDDAAGRHATREQSASSDADTETAAAILAGNREYEARFGHVFLIRAAGRSAAEIRAALTRRLRNDAETERIETTEQLREIVELRIAASVHGGEDEKGGAR